MSLRTIKTDARYKCLVKSAAPCVYDSRFDTNLADGTDNGVVIRRNQHVKEGKVCSWIDPCSRKHFEPVNKEARAQDAKDRTFLLRELKRLGVDDIPEDATLSELCKTYNHLDPRLNIGRRKQYAQKDRVFGKKEKSPEPTNAELQDQITKLGGTFGKNDNKGVLAKNLDELKAKAAK